MNKHLVDLYLPSIGKHYDICLPAGKKISEATQLLIGMIESLSNGSYKGTADSVLINATNGEIFNRNDTVYDAGIRHSSKLILT
jgi:hypothetical protein